MVGVLVPTALAMLAFAGNSLLCRLALAPGLIDAASFSTIRIVSGAVMLGALAYAGGRWPARAELDGRAAVALATYMVAFSFAYLWLPAGTGALLLFGAVQLTMFVAALVGGERLAFAGWVGALLAAGGLVYLVAPGLSAPDPAGAALMILAGIAWGAYSLLGRARSDPLRRTALNFLAATPLVAVVSVGTLGDGHWTATGALLAVTSGALTSGVGYAVWYAALRGLTAYRAAAVQLSVPVIAAMGGVVLLDEPLGFRLVVSSVATLGGIAILLGARQSRRR